MNSPFLEVAGLTCAEAQAAGASHGLKADAARRAYRATFAAINTDGPLVASPLPMVRSLQEGDLTKFVLSVGGGLEVESVVIPMWRGGESWHSLCLSSQVGCRMDCTFCETAQLGLLRNLTPAEIVGQVLAARRATNADIRKLVFMGMGEPFDNFDGVVQAIRVLTDPVGLSLSKRQITISTVGRIAGIRRLAELNWRYLQLAVSLNAPNDEIRSRIMPINRAEPMAALRAALLDFPLRRNGYFMIGYVLIPGVNDAVEHARELAAFLKPVRCCVNVIPYNPILDSPWPAPDEAGIAAFLGALRDAGQYCKRRITKGRDLMAACGQLGNRSLSRRKRERPAFADRVAPEFGQSSDAGPRLVSLNVRSPSVDANSEPIADASDDAREKPPSTEKTRP